MADVSLTSTKAVIESLGGTSAVAELTGRKYNAAWMWGVAETFPSNTYLQIQGALAEKGLSAPASLWSMNEPVAAACSAHTPDEVSIA